MAGRGLPKTGGRVAGVPNRATREFKLFLQGVFHEALIAGPDARKALVAGIQAFTLPPGILKMLAEYAFGAPSREVDVRHQGQVSLAQLVSGSALEATLGEDDEDDDDPDAADGTPPS